ncbi:MAG: hypothetical protein AB1630_06420 [bacterium]
MKVYFLIGLCFFFFIEKGYSSEFEEKLGFAPFLQLHSGNQGVSDADLLHMSTNPAFSLKSDEEGKLEEKPKKGRIIGAIIGAGIGAGFGEMLYRTPWGLGEGGNDDPGRIRFMLVPTIIGGAIGYIVGECFDKKPKKGGEKNEN